MKKIFNVLVLTLAANFLAMLIGVAWLKDERKMLDEKEKKLAEREQQAQRLASDQGFQDSLALYQTLPAKQVKTIFMGLEDGIVIQYLQAMESRTAAKITKEFKSNE